MSNQYVRTYDDFLQELDKYDNRRYDTREELSINDLCQVIVNLQEKIKVLEQKLGVG